MKNTGDSAHQFILLVQSSRQHQHWSVIRFWSSGQWWYCSFCIDSVAHTGPNSIFRILNACKRSSHNTFFLSITNLVSGLFIRLYSKIIWTLCHQAAFIALCGCRVFIQCIHGYNKRLFLLSDGSFAVQNQIFFSSFCIEAENLISTL